jgi:hypothetical protein
VEEIWKDVRDYEGLYQISNIGRCRSLDMMSRRVSKQGKEFFVLLKGKVLSENKTNGNGYRITCLCKNSKKKNNYIHRLVADAFLDKIEGSYYVNHKDADKLNNNSINLEYCTHRENMIHARKLGLVPCRKGKYYGNYGEDCSYSKLTNKQTLEIYKLAHAGELSQPEIGFKFNVSRSMVSAIKNGKRLVSITGHGEINDYA